MLPHAELQARLDAYPRLELATYPTPLHALPRLSGRLGRALYIKRDDEIGPGLGGNKTRKLEYLLAEAQRMGVRKVATFGGLQSNHARLTAAAACRLGLEAHLFYFEPRPAQMRGNLLLNQLLGAQMHFIPAGSSGRRTIEDATRLVCVVARLWLGRHYFIPVGGHSWLGALGYVRAALEIDEQARALGIEHARLVLAAGTGGTLAGLQAGLSLLGSRIRPLGIDVGRLWEGFPASVSRLTRELAGRLGHPLGPGDSAAPMIEGVYAGERYGVPSSAGVAAMRLLAEHEGILLDPVYTGKAFAAVIDLIEQGALAPGEPVIFLHTGGLPALFAFDGLPAGS